MSMLSALLLLFVPAPSPPDLTVRAILGIEAGMPADEARRLLAPLGRSEARALSAGVKEVWKLNGGGYEWIAFRADGKGRIVWLTGRRRAGREIPFETIDAKPGVATDTIAIWHSQGAHTVQRLTLRGAGRKAFVVTLAAVE